MARNHLFYLCLNNIAIRNLVTRNFCETLTLNSSIVLSSYRLNHVKIHTNVKEKHSNYFSEVGGSVSGK